MKVLFLFLLITWSLLLIGSCVEKDPGFKATVKAEETVYSYESADNGAGPMWCHGNTCIVRFGENVFASGLETLEGVKPLHNTRWTLYQRKSNGWSLLSKDDTNRTREPSPLGLFQDGRLSR